MWDNPLVIAKHEAERKIRDAFQRRYGFFWRCERCGAHIDPDTRDLRCGRCDGHYSSVRYTPPAPRSR